MTATVDRRDDRWEGRVPPQSVEAEESVLGAILLSEDAANEVMDRLDPDDFYRPAHQAVFRVMRLLYNANQAIDAITVSEELRRTGELDRIGGISAITRLLDIVPSASNVDYYAGIVEEHSQRRALIKAGSSITDLAMRLDDEIHAVIDRAEQTVLAVAGRRVKDSMQPIGPVFFSTLEELEELEARGSEITGLSTGFRDLDRKLTGLHPSNLVIIAARPAMGKCLSGDTLVVDPKTGRRTPIARLAAEGIDLSHTLSLDTDRLGFDVTAPIACKASGVQECFELTTRLGRKIVASGNHPFYTVTGWQPLSSLSVGDRVAVAGQMPAFGVDDLGDAEVALLGYLLGDGNVAGTTPRLTNIDPTVVEDARTWARQLGMELVRDGGRPTYRIVGRKRPTLADVAREAGVSAPWASRAMRRLPGPSPDTRTRVLEAVARLGYTGRRTPLQLILDGHGLTGATSHTKRVPDAIFGLGERQLALFLSRLYATDGSAWTAQGIYRVEYSTVSEQLARDVQHLLLRFGVVAKVRRRRVAYDGGYRVAWDVAFQDPRSVAAFSNRIGIFSKERSMREVARMAGQSSGAARWESLPPEVWDLVEKERGDIPWKVISEATGRPGDHNWHSGRRSPTRSTLRELSEVLGSRRLWALANSDLVFDDIVSIHPVGPWETFDLEVPGHANFVANDFVVHNSALTMNIATNVAMEGKPVAIFSLEMGKEEVATRMLCAVARIDSMKLRSGQLGEAVWPRLTDAAGKLYNAPVFVDDSPVVTVTDIRAKCRRLKRVHGLGLVVVDYLQLMQGTARENRQQEIAEISRNLKNLARELEVPIIAVSQLNRNLESREDKRPRLGDLRESGSLEQDADIVVFIYRDEYYNESSEKRGIAEVIVAKHRAGSVGTVEMTFMPEFTKFSDLGRD